VATESSQSPLGLVGRVTGRIGPGTIGEVLLSIRRGRETFFAYPAETGEEISPGETILVVEYQPPRTVYVVRWKDDTLVPEM
jgi:hypothetical protein